MRVTTKLTGRTPLLVHNVQLADPDNSWSKKIQEITKKRKKTEEDRAAIGKLEFLGSLYVHEGQVVVPTANVFKCFIQAGKVTKEGKSVSRALAMTELFVPLAYKGPKEPVALYEQQEFRDATVVRVGTQRVVRMRPIFRQWALQAEWEFLDEVLDFDAFCSVAKMAGRIEGLGDNRVNGYGRFDIEVKEVRQ